MSKKQKIMLWRILISIAMLIALGFSPVQGYLKFILYMVVYLIIGYDILLKALKGIKNRQMFDERNTGSALVTHDGPRSAVSE